MKISPEDYKEHLPKTDENDLDDDWKKIERLLIKDDEVDIDLTVGSDPYASFKWP